MDFATVNHQYFVLKLDAVLHTRGPPGGIISREQEIFWGFIWGDKVYLTLKWNFV